MEWGVQSVLEQFPTSAIEKVEVITNPSAKFDPDGMAGIINIILKKNSLKGSFGGIKSSFGTRDKYSGSISYNYRNSKLSFFSNFNASHRRNKRSGTVDRLTFTKDTSFTLNQESEGFNYRNGVGTLLGVELFLNKKNTLTFSFNQGFSNRYILNEVDYEMKDEEFALASLFRRSLINNNTGHNTTYRIQYVKQFDDVQRNLFMDISYMDALDDNAQNVNEVFSAIDSISTSVLKNQDKKVLKRLVIQIDYEHPLPKKQKIEFGLKSINNEFNTDYIQLTHDNSLNEFAENQSLTIFF